MKIYDNKKINEQFSEALGVDVTVGSNSPKYSYARFAVCKYLKEISNMSYNEIKDVMGYASHANVIYGLRRMKETLAVGDDLSRYYWQRLLDTPAERLIPASAIKVSDEVYCCTLCGEPMGVCTCYKDKEFAVFQKKTVENKTEKK